MLCEHQRFFKPLMTLISLMPSRVAKKSVKSCSSVNKKLKTSLCEQQDSLFIVF